MCVCVRVCVCVSVCVVTAVDSACLVFLAGAGAGLECCRVDNEPDPVLLCACVHDARTCFVLVCVCRRRRRRLFLSDDCDDAYALIDTGTDCPAPITDGVNDAPGSWNWTSRPAMQPRHDSSSMSRRSPGPSLPVQMFRLQARVCSAPVRGRAWSCCAHPPVAQPLALAMPAAANAPAARGEDQTVERVAPASCRAPGLGSRLGRVHQQHRHPDPAACIGMTSDFVSL